MRRLPQQAWLCLCGTAKPSLPRTHGGRLNRFRLLCCRLASQSCNRNMWFRFFQPPPVTALKDLVHLISASFPPPIPPELISPSANTSTFLVNPDVIFIRMYQDASKHHARNVGRAFFPVV